MGNGLPSEYAFDICAQTIGAKGPVLPSFGEQKNNLNPYKSY